MHDLEVFWEDSKAPIEEHKKTEIWKQRLDSSLGDICIYFYTILEESKKLKCFDTFIAGHEDDLEAHNALIEQKEKEETQKSPKGPSLLNHHQAEKGSRIKRKLGKSKIAGHGHSPENPDSPKKAGSLINRNPSPKTPRTPKSPKESPKFSPRSKSADGKTKGSWTSFKKSKSSIEEENRKSPGHHLKDNKDIHAGNYLVEIQKNDAFKCAQILMDFREYMHSSQNGINYNFNWEHIFGQRDEKKCLKFERSKHDDMQKIAEGLNSSFRTHGCLDTSLYEPKNEKNSKFDHERSFFDMLKAMTIFVEKFNTYLKVSENGKLSLAEISKKHHLKSLSGMCTSYFSVSIECQFLGCFKERNYIKEGGLSEDHLDKEKQHMILLHELVF